MCRRAAFGQERVSLVSHLRGERDVLRREEVARRRRCRAKDADARAGVRRSDPHVDSPGTQRGREIRGGESVVGVGGRIDRDAVRQRRPTEDDDLARLRNERELRGCCGWQR